MDNSKQKLIMVENDLIIKNSSVPHIPFHIIDGKGNVIADLFQNIESEKYARLFQNAPRMYNILWNVLQNYSVSINDNSIPDKDLDVLKDILELQAELLESTIKRNETTWQDEVFEKHKDEPLSEPFKKE